MKQFMIIMALAMGLINSVTAGTEQDSRPNFYSRKAEGWFWKEAMPEPEEEEEVKPVPPQTLPPAAPTGPTPMSYAWIKENLPKLHMAAVDNPTRENLLAEKLVERLMILKGANYAARSIKVAKLDPDLDPSKEKMSSMQNEESARSSADRQLERVLKTLAKRSGVWFFYRSDCSYCNSESQALEILNVKYGVNILPISVDGLPLVNGKFPEYVMDRGQAAKLGVDQVPALFLYDKRSGEAHRLSEGLISTDDLAERISMVAAESGMITKEEYDATRFDNYEKDSLSVGAAITDKPLRTDKPQEIIEMARKIIRAH